MKSFIAGIEKFQEHDYFDFIFENAPLSLRKKVMAIENRADQARTLAGHSLLLRALSDMEIDAPICADNNGKLYLYGKENTFVSVSHFHLRVMCAVSDTPVGCALDLVRERTEEEMKEILKYFSDEEKRYLEGIEDSDKRQKEFYKILTRKKSFYKLLGFAAKEDMAAFSVVPFQKTQKIGESFYQFTDYELNDGYAYAVCFQIG